LPSLTRTNLLSLAVDPEYIPGAYNAIYVCLRVQKSERVTLITDEASKSIAASLAKELASLGCEWQAFVLEDLEARPLKTMPQPVLDDMEKSQVSIFCVKAQEGELPTRMQMTDVVNRRRIRHAHMVNINRQIMLEGMRADFLKVDAISTKVVELARKAKCIRVTSTAGSDFTAEMEPTYKWLKTSGIISPEKWGNLPGGECFTTPRECNGTFVVDGVVGDHLCEKYGNLIGNPLTLKLKANRLVEASSTNKALEKDFWDYCHTDENSDRVGEFAIGTNIELKQVIGHILQDEKFPGIHIAFGNPYGAHTGADWYSATHIDVVGTKANIWLDDKQIMSEGRFLDET